MLVIHCSLYYILQSPKSTFKKQFMLILSKMKTHQPGSLPKLNQYHYIILEENILTYRHYKNKNGYKIH